MPNIALTNSSNKEPSFVKKGLNRGMENVDATSLTTPRLKQLQSMSPEVDEYNPAFLKGAKPGLFANNLGELYGNEIYAISINFKLEYVVWRTRESGGGYIGSFSNIKEANAAIELKVEEGEGKETDFTVEETHSHLMLLKDPETGDLSPTPVIMDFAKSKLSVSKSWNSKLATKGGDRFSTLWKLSTTQISMKSGGSYLNIRTELVGWVQDADYKAAEQIYASMLKSWD